ncbi:hypothetical protein GCM10010472_41100 [Pseudonocardia halophobica]|uniref:DUF7937 domain-containing protein n=1 Tax=Pseudonocardia halophobica TaxID=29401 RepID=A0A9W6L5E6_9PSEU|nr:hypothetical protein [Pseudonocardia halophobica]GLL12425.1 hypothetical protein GCM10017577_35660 [Pseudonocardia halophobica]
MAEKTIPNPDTGRRTPSTPRQVWNFTRHFLEMCIAMCVGGGALNILVFVVGPAQLGYPDLRTTAPMLALLVIACLYTLPMAAWMRFRGMAWRPLLEMSGATVALAVVLIVLAALGVLSSEDLHRWALGFCGPACVLMLPVMLLRLDMYTGRSGERTHRRASPASIV